MPEPLYGATHDFSPGKGHSSHYAKVTYTCGSDNSTATSFCRHNGSWSPVTHHCPSSKPQLSAKFCPLLKFLIYRVQ